MKNDKIELLSEKLIDDHPELAMEVLAASARLSIPLGWHYLLDIVWILLNIQEAQEKASPPATLKVLEVGAGFGLLQFILADQGYHVISADVIPRQMPERLTSMYGFEHISDREELSHAYLDHHGMNSPSRIKRLLHRLVQLSAKSCYMSIKRRLKVGITAEQPPTDDAQERPKIVLYQANAKKLTLLPDSQVDIVVSISALEHNDPKLATEIQHELLRVTKGGGKILHTISAQKTGQGFHAPSYSFLLGEQELAETYLLDSYESNFDNWDSVNLSLVNSRYLNRWLPSMYYCSGKNGMPWGVWQPGYIPVGIQKRVIK